MGPEKGRKNSARTDSGRSPPAATTQACRPRMQGRRIYFGDMFGLAGPGTGSLPSKRAPLCRRRPSHQISPLICRSRRRPQPLDERQDVGEHVPWQRDFDHSKMMYRRLTTLAPILRVPRLLSKATMRFRRPPRVAGVAVLPAQLYIRRRAAVAFDAGRRRNLSTNRGAPDQGGLTRTLPWYKTGPVGDPVGEPPGGSKLTASTPPGGGS